jgi:hypothetical protein
VAQTKHSSKSKKAEPMSVKQPVNIVAKLLNVTRRRVQQLSHDGVIPKPKDGKYDLIACLRDYVRYLQGRKGSAQK